MKLDPSIITAVVTAVEALVNRVLTLDSAAVAKIETLEGSVIKVSATSLNISITIHACNSRLIISSNDEKFDPSEVNATIEGSPLALYRWVLPKLDVDANNTDYLSDIIIHGNTQKALQFQLLLSELDLDWESDIANIIGDIPAHFIGQKIRTSFQWGKQTQQSLQANIEEHLIEESRMLPHRIELQEQFDKINELQRSTDELEARITKLNILISDQ